MPVTFDSVGAGSRLVSTSTTVSTSWSHTISTSGVNTVVFAVVNVDLRGTNTSGATVSATYGGQTMTSIDGNYLIVTGGGGSAQYDNGTIVFFLDNPPSGAQTVSVSATASLNVFCINGNSVAYQDVDFFSATPISGGNGSSTLASPTGATKVLLATSTSAITVSGWNGRYTAGGTVNSIATFIAIGDSAGTGSTYTPTPYPSPILELYPPELSGNIRANCTEPSETGVDTSTASLSHTTRPGENIAAIVVVHQLGFGPTVTVNAPSSVTYGGTAMTLINTTGQVDYTLFSDHRGRISVYGITGIAAKTTSTVSVTGLQTGGGGTHVSVMSYNNVDGFGTPVGSASASGSVSVTGSRSGAIFVAGTFGQPSFNTHLSRSGSRRTDFDLGLYLAMSQIYETKESSSALTGGYGVGFPINVAPNGWFSFF